MQGISTNIVAGLASTMVMAFSPATVEVIGGSVMIRGAN